MQPVEPKATVPAAPVKDSLGTSVIGSGVGGEQRQGVVVAEPIGLNAEGGAQGPEIQAFMKEVNTMLQRLTRLSSMKVVDSLEPEIKRVEASMAGFASAQDGVALLDSGATHPFKPLVEKDLADIVQVQLADGQKVDLQQNRAGTLMPVKNSNLDRANSVTTIVPLGTLVQEFGLHGGLGQARPTCSASRAWRVDHSCGGLVPLYRGDQGTPADRGDRSQETGATVSEHRGDAAQVSWFGDKDNVRGGIAGVPKNRQQDGRLEGFDSVGLNLPPPCWL